MSTAARLAKQRVVEAQTAALSEALRRRPTLILRLKGGALCAESPGRTPSGVTLPEDGIEGGVVVCSPARAAKARARVRCPVRIQRAAVRGRMLACPWMCEHLLGGQPLALIRHEQLSDQILRHKQWVASMSARTACE